MKKHAIWFGSLFLLVTFIGIFVWQVSAFGEMAAAGMEKADFANKRIKQLRETAETFRGLARQPLPAKLSLDQRKEAERYDDWLKDRSGKLDELANRWQAALDRTGKQRDFLLAQKQMQEMNQSFNLQYLTLQQQMQDESRRFSLLSNIMKDKHDTAKNSISNLR